MNEDNMDKRQYPNSLFNKISDKIGTLSILLP